MQSRKNKLLSITSSLAFLVLNLAVQAQNPLDSLGCKYLEGIFTKVNDPKQATAIYYQALKYLETPSPINTERLKRLEADVTDIMIDEERTAYKNLKVSIEKIVFFQRFWLIRDLTPVTETNERLIEHYKRLAYARARYSFPSSRGYDDRGQIYIQYGPPDDYVTDIMPQEFPPIETWAYQHSGAVVTFDFIDKGYGYRLANRLDDGIKRDNPVTRFNALGTLLRERAILSPAYNSAFADYLTIANDRSGLQEKLSRIEMTISRHAVENYSVQARLPKAISDILKDFSPLSFSTHLARFKEDSQRHDLAITYGLKATDLKFNQTDSTVEIALAATVSDASSANRLGGPQDTLHLITTNFQASEQFIKTLHYVIPSGRYLVALDLTNVTNRQRGLKDFSLAIGNYPTGSLHLSSVILAKSIVPIDSVTNRNVFTRHKLAITPYPFPTLSRNARMFVYFEIYDLKRDDTGETFYNVEYEVNAPSKKGFASLLASLNPFDKSGGSISVSEMRRGKAAVEPTYLQLDFGQLRSGKYNLIVRVTDKLANITKESKLEFELE